MKSFITAVSLGLSFIAASGVAMAQEGDIPVINADGDAVTSNAGLNPAADANGPTVVYGDLNPGSGTTVIGAPVSEGLTATDGDATVLGTGEASAAPGTVTRDGVSGMSLLGPDGTYSVTEVSPSNVSVGESGAPAPVSEPAPEAVVETVETAAPVESAAPVVTETAVATETDLDADNYVDALELEVGLDPSNPDSDGDGVADGDEVTIYSTDPFTWDSDGDGLADGEELFGILTDPLLWDTDGDGLGDGETVVV